MGNIAVREAIARVDGLMSRGVMCDVIHVYMTDSDEGVYYTNVKVAYSGEEQDTFTDGLVSYNPYEIIENQKLIVKELQEIASTTHTWLAEKLLIDYLDESDFKRDIPNLVYVDLETGGIPTSTGIYEVGLIATRNGQILDSMTIGLVINSDRLSEGMGQGYACISDDEQYINQFKQFVAKYPFPLVAHNAQFDKGFLVHYGWIDRNTEFIDTLALFRKHIPKSAIENYKLGTIMDYYGVQVDGTLHTAISDLKGLVECVNKSGVLGDFEQTNQTETSTIAIKLKTNGTQFMRTEGSMDLTYKEIDKATFTQLSQVPTNVLENEVKKLYKKDIDLGYGFHGCYVEDLHGKYYLVVRFSLARQTNTVVEDFRQTNQTPQNQNSKWSNVSIYTDVVGGVRGSVDGYRRFYDEVEEVTIVEIHAQAINGEVYIKLKYHDLDGLTDEYMQTKIQQALETVKRLAVEKYAERLNNPVPTITNTDRIDVKTIKGTPINRDEPIFHRIRIYDDKTEANLEGKLRRAIGSYSKIIIKSSGYYNERRDLEFIPQSDLEYIIARLENSGLEYQLLESMVREDIYD